MRDEFGDRLGYVLPRVLVTPIGKRGHAAFEDDIVSISFCWRSGPSAVETALTVRCVLRDVLINEDAMMAWKGETAAYLLDHLAETLDPDLVVSDPKMVGNRVLINWSIPVSE